MGASPSVLGKRSPDGAPASSGKVCVVRMACSRISLALHPGYSCRRHETHRARPASSPLWAPRHRHRASSRCRPGPRRKPGGCGLNFIRCTPKCAAFRSRRFAATGARRPNTSASCFPKDLLVENGTDLMAYSHQSFALAGNFDRSKTQAGRAGRRLPDLRRREGLVPADHRRGHAQGALRRRDPEQDAIRRAGARARATIALFHCMECHDSGLLRWNREEEGLRLGAEPAHRLAKPVQAATRAPSTAPALRSRPSAGAAPSRYRRRHVRDRPCARIGAGLDQEARVVSRCSRAA